MRYVAILLLIVGIALLVFELPAALTATDADVERDWAIAGAIASTVLIATGLVCLMITRRRSQRRASLRRPARRTSRS